MRVLLVSTYELGHQPLHLASPAAALRRAGHDVRCLDLAVGAWDAATLAWCEAVAFSVPMHTAMRLALPAAAAIREQRPELPLCLYGLYAPVSRELTLGRYVDEIVAGEYEPGLVAWVDRLARRGLAPAASPGLAPAASPGLSPAASPVTAMHDPPSPVVGLGRGGFAPPARDLLPPLSSYARLAVGAQRQLVGYVEASHGCLHTCLHCPVPAVYGGRIRVVERDVVLADIDALAAAGARHITFGDPDFLNAPGHARRLVRAMHERLPDLTWDCTTKVEHILRHAELWEDFAAAGCLFVVSALECVNDGILARLEKGHTSADAVSAIQMLRRHDIEPRPSFLPFTPWTTLGDVADLLDFVAVHDLVDNVDPVQYTIRLLLPEGSLLLDHPDLWPHLGPYDPERLSYSWTTADPEVDRLQAALSRLVQEREGELYAATFLDIRAAVAAAGATSGIRGLADVVPVGSTEGRPRLTEPWFC